MARALRVRGHTSMCHCSLQFANIPGAVHGQGWSSREDSPVLLPPGKAGSLPLLESWQAARKGILTWTAIAAAPGTPPPRARLPARFSVSARGSFSLVLYATAGIRLGTAGGRAAAAAAAAAGGSCSMGCISERLVGVGRRARGGAWLAGSRSGALRVWERTTAADASPSPVAYSSGGSMVPIAGIAAATAVRLNCYLAPWLPLPPSCSSWRARGWAQWCRTVQILRMADCSVPASAGSHLIRHPPAAASGCGP